MFKPDFKFLVDPVSEETFFKDYWTKKFLHIQRADPEYFKDLLTLKDIDTIITTQNHPSMRIVKQKQLVPGELYSTGKDVLAMIEYFNQGASIIFDRLDTTWEPLRQLGWNVYNQLGTAKDILSNVYFTPASSQAFKIHMDWQDNFILQVEGEKTWNLFESELKYPLSDRQSKTFASGIDASKKTHTITLKKGDTLYVPRGLAHEVMTNDHQSLHVTFTIFPMTYFDICISILNKAADVVQDLRMGVTGDFYKQPKLHHNKILDVLKNMSEADLERMVREIQWEYSNQSNNGNLRNYFLDQQKLNSEDIVELTFLLRRDVHINFKKINETAYSIQTKHNEFTIDLANIELEHIIKGNSFKLNQLPGELKREDKIALLRNLTGAGILSVL